MKLYLVFVLMMLSIATYSQSNNYLKKIHFQFSALAGPLDGEGGTSAQIEMVPGIKYRGYFIGIGSGLDYYFIRTVPLFLELKKEFKPNKNSVFVYADAGFDYPWPSASNKLDQGQMNLDNGHRLAGGIGYQFSINKKMFLQLSAGYSYKQIKENLPGMVTIYDPRVDWLDYTQHYNYKLNRLAFNIGVTF